jgi:hypothetical protein
MERLIWKDEIDQMMPDSFLFIKDRFVCADIHVLINLHRIGADDFAPEFLSQLNGQSRFPCSGWAQENHESGSFYDDFRLHTQGILMNSTE